MTYLDLTVLYSVAVKDNQLVASTIGVAAIIATTAAYYALSSKDEKHEFPKLQGIQLYHAWNFFQRRYDFLQSNFERKLGSFSFNVLNNKVIALAGADARQAFFTKSHFNFSQGNKILMGAVRISLVQPRKRLLIPEILGTPAQQRQDRRTREGGSWHPAFEQEDE